MSKHQDTLDKRGPFPTPAPCFGVGGLLPAPDFGHSHVTCLGQGDVSAHACGRIGGAETYLHRVTLPCLHDRVLLNPPNRSAEPRPPPPGWVQGRVRDPDSEPVSEGVTAHWGSRWSSQDKGQSALQSRGREMMPAKNETVGAAGFEGKA